MSQLNKFAVKLMIESRRIVPTTDQTQWDEKTKEFVDGVNWVVNDLLSALETLEAEE